MELLQQKIIISRKRAHNIVKEVCQNLKKVQRACILSLK